jgi:hypothetical protein
MGLLRRSKSPVDVFSPGRRTAAGHRPYNLSMSAEALPGADSLCRNCGAGAPGAFCPACGQETDTRLPTLRKFMRDATGRLVSFDSRLWRTIFALVARPGFLTREYLDGRRRRYVRPTRLYLIMSLLLFAVLRMVMPPLYLDDRGIILYDGDEPVPSQRKSTERARPAGAAGAPSPAPHKADPEFNITLDNDHNIVVAEGLRDPLPKALRERIDRFNALPRAEKGEQISAGMLRYGPYAMFVLLPAYAWLQQILYLGRARRYPGRPRKYVEHLVYAAHIHTFLFLVAAVAIVLDSWIGWALGAWVVYYLYRAKRTIYGGSRIGGLLRGFFVLIGYFVLFVLATVALFVAAILLR